MLFITLLLILFVNFILTQAAVEHKIPQKKFIMHRFTGLTYALSLSNGII